MYHRSIEKEDKPLGIQQNTVTLYISKSDTFFFFFILSDNLNTLTVNITKKEYMT